MTIRSTLLLATGVLSVVVAANAIAQTAPVPVTPGSATPGVVDPNHPRVNQVDQRLDNQQNAVNKDVSNGSITANQASRDAARDARVQKQATADEAKNGGKLTKAEQRKLNREMNKNKKDIAHQKKVDAKKAAATPAAPVAQ